MPQDSSIDFDSANHILPNQHPRKNLLASDLISSLNFCYLYVHHNITSSPHLQLPTSLYNFQTLQNASSIPLRRSRTLAPNSRSSSSSATANPPCYHCSSSRDTGSSSTACTTCTARKCWTWVIWTDGQYCCVSLLYPFPLCSPFAFQRPAKL